MHTDAAQPKESPRFFSWRAYRYRWLLIFSPFIGALVLSVVIPIAIHGTVLPKRFAVVDPGVLYRSGQPKTAQIAGLIESHHIKTIIIVRSDISGSAPDEIPFARQRGLNVVHIPIESRKPISDAQTSEFFRCVDDPANRPVLIHCSAGRHRTGYLCALYRIERQGWPVQKAIDELLSFGFNTKDQSVLLDELRRHPERSAPRP